MVCAVLTENSLHENQQTGNAAVWSSLTMFAIIHQGNQICGRGGTQFVSHGHEFGPVATETSRVDPGVHHEPPEGTAGGFLSQGDPCLSLGHIVADIDDLHDQQVKQPTGHDAAVPRTGETQRSAVLVVDSWTVEQSGEEVLSWTHTLQHQADAVQRRQQEEAEC